MFIQMLKIFMYNSVSKDKLLTDVNISIYLYYLCASELYFYYRCFLSVFDSFLLRKFFGKIKRNKPYGFFFKSKKKKLNKYIYGITTYIGKHDKLKLFHQPNKVTNKINYIILHKRRLGLLKFRHDKKKFNMNNAAYRLDFKKLWLDKPNIRISENLKKVSKIRKWLYKYYSVSKKNFTKFFIKKVRNSKISYSVYNCIRQKKKTKILNNSKILVNNIPPYTILHFFKNMGFFNGPKDISAFIKKIGYYKNNTYSNNAKDVLLEGDVVQLPNYKYIYKFLFQRRNKKYKILKKVKPRLFRLIRNKLDPHKQSSKRLPSFALKLTYFDWKKLANIEYDYISMCFVCISLSTFNNDLSDSKYAYDTYYLSRLYNWKYIV